MSLRFFVATTALGTVLSTAAAHGQTWTCGKDLKPSAAASATTAGFDFGLSPESVDKSSCSSSHPFFFSAPVKEGNYLVTLTLGGNAAGETTIKAESRRLMLRDIKTAAGKTLTQTFVVNVRTPQITATEEVKRKPRELASLDWDNKLTLEFSGTHPVVHSIHIEPAPAKTITVYLAGDSTVVDQDKEPWAAWGQMLPAFFNSNVAIANHAESGETIASFESERRFAKIFSLIRPGDYIFFQFAHNDQKPGRGYVSPERYQQLLHLYIAKAKEKGATPVLVTSMNRRTFDESGHIKDTLAPYPQLVRDVAAQEHLAVIDLNAMSKTLYEAIGEAHSKTLFVYADANTYPNQNEALHDDTHFNSYGAYELARCVVYAIQKNNLPLAAHLRKGLASFHPASPDPAETVAIPPTPFVDSEKPYER